jgi:hypothetical protein
MKTLQQIWVILLLQPVFVQGQTMESGDVFNKISSIISSMPLENGDDYTEPTNGEIVDWTDMLDDLFAANYASADIKADALGYELVEFSDNTTNETYYVLEKSAMGTHYWGTYILNPNAQREEVILMAPHPRKDFNTGKQGIFCFQEIDAGFFMMAGTHRCNHTDESLCSGMTDACGASAPFRISDLAHSVNSIWQTTTDYLLNLTSDSYFIQLHGFTKTASDPYVIMSNGTRDNPAPAPDPIISIRDELLIADPMLTFKIGHIDLAWDRLLGFTNTNGRLINASNNICSSDATTPSGRFVHIEQEKTRLRDDMSGWQKMATALTESFPLAALPVELAAFDAEVLGKKVLLSWQVDSETNNDFFEIEKSNDGKAFRSIGKITGRGQANTPKEYQFWDNPNNGNNYYRIRQVDFDGRMEFSPIRLIHYNGEKNTDFRTFVSNGQIIVQIDNHETDDVQFELFDALGRNWAINKLDFGENIILAEQMQKGIYFFRIKNERQILATGILPMN